MSKRLLDDPSRQKQAAGVTRADTRDRSRRDLAARGEGRIRLVPRPQIGVEEHADIPTANLSTPQDTNVCCALTLVSTYTRGMGNDSQKSDEEIAVECLATLWPKGTWPAGARATGIPAKTFSRICQGGAIKSANWEKLRANPEFAAEFARLTRAQEPQLSTTEKEALGRLSRAFGPRNLKAALYELESLVALVGPTRAIRLLELQAESAAEVAESAQGSQPEPKRRG